MSAMVIGVSMLAGNAMYAAPLVVSSPVYAMFAAEKPVKFNLHNATDIPIKVKAGDTEMTLSPGKVVPMKLAAGTKVIVEEAGTHYAQGSVIAVASSELSDATVTLN